MNSEMESKAGDKMDFLSVIYLQRKSYHCYSCGKCETFLHWNICNCSKVFM